MDHENFFENILGHQVKFSSVLHDHIYLRKKFEVRQCLDRNMKYKTCIIGHFFDLMITLRASIWSSFGHHFGVPPIACAISGEKWEVHGEGLKVASLLENGSKLSPEKNRL